MHVKSKRWPSAITNGPDASLGKRQVMLKNTFGAGDWTANYNPETGTYFDANGKPVDVHLGADTAGLRRMVGNPSPPGSEGVWMANENERVRRHWAAHEFDGRYALASRSPRALPRDIYSFLPEKNGIAKLWLGKKFVPYIPCFRGELYVYVDNKGVARISRNKGTDGAPLIRVSELMDSKAHKRSYGALPRESAHFEFCALDRTWRGKFLPDGTVEVTIDGHNETHRKTAKLGKFESVERPPDQIATDSVANEGPLMISADALAAINQAMGSVLGRCGGYSAARGMPKGDHKTLDFTIRNTDGVAITNSHEPATRPGGTIQCTVAYPTRLRPPSPPRPISLPDINIEKDGPRLMKGLNAAWRQLATHTDRSRSRVSYPVNPHFILDGDNRLALVYSFSTTTDAGNVTTNAKHLV